jgi:hypothetical protein
MHKPTNELVVIAAQRVPRPYGDERQFTRCDSPDSIQAHILGYGFLLTVRGPTKRSIEAIMIGTVGVNLCEWRLVHLIERIDIDAVGASSVCHGRDDWMRKPWMRGQSDRDRRTGYGQAVIIGRDTRDVQCDRRGQNRQNRWDKDTRFDAACWVDG